MALTSVKQRIVLCHPDTKSLCSAIAKRWLARAQGHHQECEVRDLYAEGFDPVLKSNEQPGKQGYAPLKVNLAELEVLKALDVLVFVYPIWFGSPPAMLKGYFERVVGCGNVVNTQGHAKPLAGVRLVSICTSGARGVWLAEKGVTGALHTIFDQYVSEAFGSKKTYRIHLDSIDDRTDDFFIRTRLADVDQFADQVCADAYGDVRGLSPS
jgi:NAD(P)H dehydrogenase (quinone)